MPSSYLQDIIYWLRRRLKFLPAACIIGMLVSLQTLAQPNISRIEYYYDIDPGFGNATSLSFTAGTDLQNLTIPVNPAPLTEGVHRLYVRAKSNSGWSMTNTWLFYKPYSSSTAPPAPQPAPNISRIEYYFDTDPGYGNATALPFTAGTDLANLIIPVNPDPLSEGVHRLYLRAKSSNGWSMTNTWLFYKPYAASTAPPAPGPVPNLTAIEYYINDDPGNGNGIPLAFEATTNLADADVFVNISGLPTGDHHFYLRGKDANGSWSMVNDKLFSITAAQSSPSIIINSISKTTMCAQDSFSVAYHAVGSFTGGNTFTLELSNGSGSFATPTVLKTVVATSSGLIKLRLPSHLPDGTGYKLRLRSSTPALTSVVSATTLTIRDRPIAQTITGKTFVNGTYTWPYSVLNVATSTYTWLISGGVKASGGNTNAITATFNQPATDSLIGYIRSIETNQYGCIGDTSILSPIVIYKLAIGDTVAASVCKGTTLVIKTGSTGSFDAGNNLVAELSNATGSFATPTATVTKAFTANGTNRLNSFDMPIPAGLPNGTGYRVRIRSTSPAFTGDTSAAISIVKPDIGVDRNGTYCSGYGFNLKQFYNDNSLLYGYYTNAFVVINKPDSVQAGSYRIIGTNSIGCTDTATVTVTTNPSPAIGPDTTVYRTCPGETTNLLPLYSTTGLTAVWNTATPTAAPPGNYRLVVTNSFNCTDTAFAKIVLETATWTGATSNNWHTATNWNTGKVPTEKTHVIIPAATPNACIISDADGIAASVQVKSGGNLKISASRKLDINARCNSLPAN